MSEFSKNARILVVDDDESERDILKFVLNQFGYQNVIFAESGGEALEALQREDFELVISDYQMPGGMTGLTLCARVRQLEKYKGTSFFLRSGVMDGPLRERATRIGATACFQKPPSLEELRSDLKQMLGVGLDV